MLYYALGVLIVGVVVGLLGLVGIAAVPAQIGGVAGDSQMTGQTTEGCTS